MRRAFIRSAQTCLVLLALTLIGCNHQYPRSEYGLSLLPPALRPVLVANRCSTNTDCKPRACATDSGRCEAGFCQYTRAASCACFESELQLCAPTQPQACASGAQACGASGTGWSACYELAVCPAGSQIAAATPRPVSPSSGPPTREDCYPDCSFKRCGDDGCGGSCGSCDTGQKCGDDGQCCNTGPPASKVGDPCQLPNDCGELVLVCGIGDPRLACSDKHVCCDSTTSSCGSASPTTPSTPPTPSAPPTSPFPNRPVCTTCTVGWNAVPGGCTTEQVKTMMMDDWHVDVGYVYGTLKIDPPSSTSKVFRSFIRVDYLDGGCSDDYNDAVSYSVDTGAGGIDGAIIVNRDAGQSFAKTGKPQDIMNWNSCTFKKAGNWTPPLQGACHRNAVLDVTWFALCAAPPHVYHGGSR